MNGLLMGILGGLLGGALVGLAEAGWVVANAAGDIDRMALPYATVLYGLIGAGMGTGVGVGNLVLGKLWKGMQHTLAWTLGFLGALVPLGLVIGRYYANKVIYAEAGVPMSGNLALLGIFGLIAVITLAIAPKLMAGPLSALPRVRGSAGIWLGTLAAAAGFAVATAPATPALSPDRAQAADLKDAPNVLLIMVDTLRADHLSPYDDKWAGKTPTIQALADDGVVFEAAHANSSWTRPGFANVYTSMVPTSHTASAKSAMLPDSVETLAEVLQNRGYVTGGLPNNTNVTSTFNFHQGFDYYPYMAPNMPFGATESTYQLAMYSVLRKVGERLQGDTKEVSDFYQPAETVLGISQDFIAAQGDKRWFLMTHLMEPHDPYFERPYNGTGYGRAEHEVPEADKVEYLKQTYATEIEWMDKDVATFIAWLKESGQYDDTLIILAADHGEEFLEHGGWWHGTTLYQEQIHIPLIVKLPGSAHKGTRAPWTVRQIDIAPTIAAATGATAPATWQGGDLLGEDFATFTAPPPAPAAPAEGAEAPADGTAQVAPDPVNPRGFDRVVLAEEDFEGNQITAVRQGDWKLIQANEGNPRGLETAELYDLALDRGEQKNLAASEPSTLEGLESIAKLEVAKAAGEAAEGGGQAELDPVECARLQALGYVDQCGAPE